MCVDSVAVYIESKVHEWVFRCETKSRYESISKAVLLVCRPADEAWGLDSSYPQSGTIRSPRQVLTRDPCKFSYRLGPRASVSAVAPRPGILAVHKPEFLLSFWSPGMRYSLRERGGTEARQGAHIETKSRRDWPLLRATTNTHG